MNGRILTRIAENIAPLLCSILKTLGPIAKRLPEENPVWLAAHLAGTYQAKKTCAAQGKSLSARAQAESARSELLLAQNWVIAHARKPDTPAAAVEGLKAINELLAQAIMIIDSELLASPEKPQPRREVEGTA